MTDKASKPRAHYRAGSTHYRCGLCTMFQPPHGCSAVKGEVAEDGLCDFFKRKAGSKARGAWYGAMPATKEQ